MKMKCKIKKLICLLTIITMFLSFPVVNAHAATLTDVSIFPVQNTVNNDGTVTVSGKITGSGTAKVLVAAYDATGDLVTVSLSEDINLSSGEGTFDVTTIKPGDKLKMFVWENLDSLTPLSNVLTLLDTQITTKNMANGVVVSWDAVDGAASYSLYREGTLVAQNLTSTTYSDKYFSTIEGMLGETYAYPQKGNNTITDMSTKTAEPNTDYTYTVVADNNIMLASSDGKADSEQYIAYITFNDAGQTNFADVNDDSNGIILTGHTNHLQTALTGSSAGANRYAVRTVATTADDNGIKVTPSYAFKSSVNHLPGYNEGGKLNSAIRLQNISGKISLFCGLTQTGDKAYKYKTDADGYVLDADGNRVTDIANAAFTEEADTWTNNNTTYSNIMTSTTVNAPYAYVEKFAAQTNNANIKRYTFLMNGRFNDDKLWQIPTTGANAGGNDPKNLTIDGVTMLETGKQLVYDYSNNIGSSTAYRPVAVDSNKQNAITTKNEYWTYMYEANVQFASDRGAFGSTKREGYIGNMTQSGYANGFNTQLWNLRFYGAEHADYLWMHSFAVIPSEYYIK